MDLLRLQRENLRISQENHRLRLLNENLSERLRERDKKPSSLRYIYDKGKRISAINQYEKAERQARKRGKEFLLSADEYYELVDNYNCYYCNHPLGLTGVRLDRLDNSQGYAVHNVVPCCSRCNQFRKDSLTPEEMVEVGRLFRKFDKRKSS